MAEILLDAVTKRYAGPEGTITAVDDVDLRIDDGEFLVLVGPSGCGKTTTLRMIAGLETVDEGAVRIGDRDITTVPPRNRDIAMVFQNYALYPHKTVRGNIAYGLEKSESLSEAEVDQRVTEFASMMGIEELLDKKPAQLSGGQKQRTALGRALVRDPAAFLMDEPLSNLDAQLRLHMRTEIQQLQSDLDITTVYVTHDQEEAMTMGDRIAVMRDGEIQQRGTPEAIYDRPVNRFVAEFIGQPNMNFVPVTLEDGVARADFFAVELPDVDDLDPGDYTLGVRPEDIRLASASGAETSEAPVAVTEPTGSDVVVYLDVEHDVSIETGREELSTDASQVTFSVPASKVYLFDDETGDTVYVGSSKRPAADADQVNTLST